MIVVTGGDSGNLGPLLGIVKEKIQSSGMHQKNDSNISTLKREETEELLEATKEKEENK
jgi:hypothetical protein